MKKYFLNKFNLPAYISPTCSRTPPSRRACSWQGQGRSTLSTSMSTPWQCASVFGCHRLGPERTFGSYGIHGNGISTFRRKPFSRGACLCACRLCLCRRHCSPPLCADPGCRPSAFGRGGCSCHLLLPWRHSSGWQRRSISLPIWVGFCGLFRRRS